jgi:23S rRNA U2552 (ribose-2'-O)-methylase RlmE/FtsJ
MLHFILPRLHPLTYTYIESNQENDSSVIISNSLCHFLFDIKKKIDFYGRDWDIYKKYTNPFEFIHTIIPTKKKCVAKYNPLSRSYFKMIEIFTFFKMNFPKTTTPISCFHLAEGPGGFIEAIVEILNNSSNIYIGMTLINNDNTNPNVPAWKKSNTFLQNNPNVFIENGRDGTGDILTIANFEHVTTIYASSMDIVTADGGFDFSLDFDHQESNMSRLLMGQVIYGLAIQKYKGSFILKIFDAFMAHTVDILAILSSFYECVIVCKPQTSRYANSEKYVVCTGFIHHSNEKFLPYLTQCFHNIIEAGPSCNWKRFLSCNIPSYFISRIDEYNAIFGQQQIEYIHSTISLIENNNKEFKIFNLMKINVQKSIHWCIKHNMSYNIINIFGGEGRLPSNNGYHQSGIVRKQQLAVRRGFL